MKISILANHTRKLGTFGPTFRVLVAHLALSGGEKGMFCNWVDGALCVSETSSSTCWVPSASFKDREVHRSQGGRLIDDLRLVVEQGEIHIEGNQQQRVIPLSRLTGGDRIPPSYENDRYHSSGKNNMALDGSASP
jgi:hypothetical protein